ncbi:hypothetical protein PF008_g6734 [Phytophthora fragariae]|uniref:Uncharacterized protein n=1 Tax=Phytophthora fragariae TaxID=53985 RepID=A0A6G0S4J2_9STRA|nr:hypothetical protein PF008_g6734 [Phytophthora fragariae]
MTTGSGSKQRSVKERPGSAGGGTKSSLQAKDRDDEDRAAVAHAGAETTTPPRSAGAAATPGRSCAFI